MGSGSTMKPLDDPDTLIREAYILLDRDGALASAPRTSLEEDIRRAHQMVAGDMEKIEGFRRDKLEIPFDEIFGSAQDDKLAAIIYLATHKMLDVTYGPAQALDIVDARRDLTGYVDILFRLNAVEGIGILYDFSLAQSERRDPQTWQKMLSYYLLLLVKMIDARARVIGFLKDRPHARRAVEQLMASTDQNVAAAFRALGEEYVRAKKDTDADTLPEPRYVRLYSQYNLTQPDERLLGTASLLAAQERILRAVEEADFPTLAFWVKDGSPAAARLVFSTARSFLSTGVVTKLLELILSKTDIAPVRLAAAVLELGDINHIVSPAGGEMLINRTLTDFACTDDKLLVNVARLAVQQLRNVTDFNDMLTVMERAPLIEVAEEAVRALCDMRRLQMADSVIRTRPVLTLAYQSAQRYLQEVQSLMSSAWSCQNEEMARVYIERLKSLNALPELEQLGTRHKHISELANKTLAALRLESTSTRKR